MNSFLEAMTMLIEALYTPLIEALETIPMLSIQIMFGTGYINFAQLIATTLTLFIYGAVLYFPTALIFRVLKRLLGVIN